MDVIIDIQEKTDTENFEDAYKVSLAIERTLKDLGIGYKMRNKSWFAGDGKYIGFQIETE